MAVLGAAVSQEVYNRGIVPPTYQEGWFKAELNKIVRAIPKTLASLTDYIVGTYTPAMAIGAGSPTTYSVRTGTYTKVGNRVHVNVRVTLSAKGASAGTVTITMPFSAAEDSLMNLSENGINLAAGWLRAYISSGTTTLNIQIRTFGSPIGNANATDAILTNTSDFMISGSYRFS